MAPRAGQLVKVHAATCGYHRTSNRPQRAARSGIGDDFQHGRRRHCPGAEVYLRIIVLTEACRRGEASSSCRSAEAGLALAAQAAVLALAGAQVVPPDPDRR